MAEAVRRLESRSNPDVVRRLIARPIRLEHSRHLPPQPEPDLAPEPAEDAAPSEADRDLAVLEAELALLKAVLQAEREEAAKLRARLTGPDDEAGAEIRAIRERWAALVDHLLLNRR